MQLPAFLLSTTCFSILFLGFILAVKESLYRLAHVILQTKDPIHGGKGSFLRRLVCDRRRHDGAFTAWAAPTAVRLVLPLVRLVTAAPHVVVIRHYFGGGCADDRVAASGAVPTSSETHIELGYGVATAAEVGRHQGHYGSVERRVISVEALAGGDERDEGVHAELLGLGSGDGVRT
jgi:hypothetical protein